MGSEIELKAMSADGWCFAKWQAGEKIPGETVNLRYSTSNTPFLTMVHSIVTKSKNSVGEEYWTGGSNLVYIIIGE